MSAITRRGRSRFLYVTRHDSCQREPLDLSMPTKVPLAFATLPFGFCGTTWRAFIVAESFAVAAPAPRAVPDASSASAATTSNNLSFLVVIMMTPSRPHSRGTAHFLSLGAD